MALGPESSGALAPAPPMLPARYRLARVQRETSDTATLELVPVDAPLPPAEPGQFHMVWAFGIGEVPISVSNRPRPGEPVCHTIRGVGAVTSALCEAQPGTVVGLRGPFGSAWEVEDGAGGDLVMVAGGIGLAPLRPAVLRALEERERFDRVVLLVGARSPDELIFTADLDRWRSEGDLEVVVTVDYGPPGWRGDVGVVTKLLSRVSFDPSRTLALVCGPEVMMRFSARALNDRGVTPDRVRVSLERNMHCAVRHCGHCQLGPFFVCADGPVFAWDRIERYLGVREL